MCESAKKASRMPKQMDAINNPDILGRLFPQASQSADISEPKPKAEEMKPNPAGPECNTSVAKSGSTTLKLIPKREMMPMTTMINRTAGVRDRKSTRLNSSHVSI